MFVGEGEAMETCLYQLPPRNFIERFERRIEKRLKESKNLIKLKFGAEIGAKMLNPRVKSETR